MVLKKVNYSNHRNPLRAQPILTHIEGRFEGETAKTGKKFLFSSFLATIPVGIFVGKFVGVTVGAILDVVEGFVVGFEVGEAKKNR